MIKEGFIICENTYKEGFLSGINGFYDYTFLTMDELFKKLLFDVKKEGIIKISLKYNLKPEIVKEYIKYLKYINLFYDAPKLNFLKEIYEYLLSENMIIFDDKYKSYLKTKNITIAGYVHSKELDYLMNLLDNLGYKYEYIDGNKNETIKRDVYQFDDINDESRFIFNKIKELLDTNVSISNIKIANYNADYDFIFKRLENEYKIPINFSSDKNIMATPIARFIMSNIDKYNTYYEIIDELKNKYSNSTYLKKIISIINSYHLYNYKPEETKDIMLMELKNINYDRKIYEDGIMLTDLGSPQIKPGDHVFVIGFNQGYIPVVYDDSKYLTDDILDNMNLDTSIDLTIQNEEILIHNLNIDNIDYIISYKLNSPFESYRKSELIKKLGYNEIKINNSCGINEAEDKIIFGDALDNYNKYGKMNDEIKNIIYDINYLSFNNKFRPISDENLKKYLPEVIKLSYSSMSNYSKCAFRYLMSSILYLDKFESGLSAYIGTYSHKILELSYDCDDFNKNKEIALNEVLKEKKDANFGEDSPLTNKERFFIDSMDQILKEVIEFNKEHETFKTNVLQEFEFDIKYDNDKLVFKGFVDKILIEDDGNTYITIIDYKTGSDEPSLANVMDGFNLQLPIYLFMIKNSNKFKNPIITGFYLQKIGPKDYPNFKLKGFTNSDPEIMNHIDNFSDSSTYINGLRKTKDGQLYGSSKVISNEQMDELSKLVENVMLERYEAIRGGKFDINPKADKNVCLGCEYCNFKDVCFKTDDDIVKILHTDFLKDGDE